MKKSPQKIEEFHQNLSPSISHKIIVRFARISRFIEYLKNLNFQKGTLFRGVEI